MPFSYAYSLDFIEKYKSYTSFSLYNIYLIDAAAVFFVTVALTNLYWHKKSFLTSLLYRNGAPVRTTSRQNDSIKLVSGWCPISMLAFTLFVFLSFFWSGSSFLSAFWGIRLLVIIFALITVTSLIKSSDFYYNLFFKIFILTGVLESIVALVQFISQKSTGLYLFGESRLGSNILGLARVDLLGHSLLRAYGTFPHPNILGGFLLFTISATVWYIRNILETRRLLASWASGAYLLGIQLIGLGLTFSRSAITGLLLILIFSLCRDRFKTCLYIERNSINNRKIIALITGIIVIFFLLIVRTPIQNTLSGKDLTTRLRIEYAAAAYHRFITAPILGRGWGTGPIELPAFSNFSFYPWELQPVHNIYLSVLSDLGIVGFLIFIYFIYRTLKKPSNIWKYLFIAYLFIGLFDHYLLTLPQGIFIFFGSAILCRRERIFSFAPPLGKREVSIAHR